MNPETQKVLACCQKLIATLEAGHRTHQAKEALKEAVKEFPETPSHWVDRKERQPKYAGAVTCFGTLYKGTEHEVKTSFAAYWDGDSRFVDKNGEDLTYINESVEYWLDLTQVPDPF
jgi:hypothetical protein